MKERIIEQEFIYKGFPCVVIFTWGLHRCGYVGVPETHPLFNVSYSDKIHSPELLKELKSASFGKRGIIPLFCWDGKAVSLDVLFDVHGGITFSDSHPRQEYPTKLNQPLWWLGFDCAHHNDAKDYRTAMAYFPRKHWEPVLEMDQKFPINNRIVRTREYVGKECRCLVEQIICVSQLLPSHTNRLFPSYRKDKIK